MYIYLTVFVLMIMRNDLAVINVLLLGSIKRIEMIYLFTGLNHYGEKNILHVCRCCA